MPKCPAPWCGKDLVENQEDHPGHRAMAKEIESGEALYVVVENPPGLDVFRFSAVRSKVYGNPHHSG